MSGIPGGFEVDEVVYFVGNGFSNVERGMRWIYGAEGKVVSAGTGDFECQVAVDFPENPSFVFCAVEDLSRTRPGAIPGAFQVDETVYFIGQSFSHEESGLRWRYGARGRVLGPCSGDAEEVSVEFAHSRQSVPCPVKELAKESPWSLPGGYEVEERVYYIGRGTTDEETGLQWIYGAPGRVVGPGIGTFTDQLAVDFPQNSGPIFCAVEDLSREPSGPLPGGFEVNETVYYTGHEMDDEETGLRWIYGASGKIVGPGTGEFQDQVTVLFPHNRGETFCTVAELSRELPASPPDEPVSS